MRPYVAVLVLAAACSSPPLLSESEQLAVTVFGGGAMGDVTVGSTSSPRYIRVNPAGSGASYNTVVSVDEGCPNFSVDPGFLPADVYRQCTGGEIPYLSPEDRAAGLFPPNCQGGYESVNYEFPVYFSPTVAGPQECTIYIDMAGSNESVIVTAIGLAPPIDISVAPGALNFGDVRVATASSPASVNVTNLGGSTLAVSSVAVPAGYTLTGGATTFNVGSGATQSLTLTCNPGAAGRVDGTLSIFSNDPQTPQVNVALACNGIDSNLGIAPSPATLATRVGEPLEQTIQLNNSGAAATTIGVVSLASTGMTLVSAPAPGTVLPGGGSLDVRVAFDASAQGEQTGTLNVETSDGMRTSQVNARAALASMALSPSGAAAFGPVCVGQTATQEFSVLGNADGAFDIESVTAPDGPFTAVLPGFPARVLGLGASQVWFEVTAAPTTVGMATSAITLTTDIPGDVEHPIDLSVEGLAAGVSATPLELDLGGQQVETTTIGQPVRLTNCAATETTFSNPRIEGIDASEFAIVQQPNGATVGANASVEWLIVLTVRSVGTKSATFLVDYPGGTASVALTGDGLGKLDAPGGAGGGADTSYYSCSAGTGAAGWPVLLGFALILRRRRRSARA